MVDLNKYELTYNENTRTFELRVFDREGEMGKTIQRATKHLIIQMMLAMNDESGWFVKGTETTIIDKCTLGFRCILK